MTCLGDYVPGLYQMHITRINKINILINHPKAFLFNVE